MMNELKGDRGELDDVYNTGVISTLKDEGDKTPSMEQEQSGYDDTNIDTLLDNNLEYRIIPESILPIVAGLQSHIKLLSNQCHIHKMR